MNLPVVFWIVVAGLLYVFIELWVSTRKGGYPSATFWVLCVVLGAIIVVMLRSYS